VWREHWWEKDVDGEVRRKAKEAARFRMRSTENLSDDAERRLEVIWALTSELRQKLDATLALAQSERPLADSGMNWNSDHWRLGVANGVVDLRTGKLRDGLPTDRSTLHTRVEFNSSARCPRWEKFLSEVFGRDAELILYIQRALGYCLTGDMSEQCVFLCFGAGGNGKTTLLEAVRYALGDYAHNLPFSAFELKARTSIPNDVASLVGKRFVTAIETSESLRLNEQRIKMLTGGDVVSARFLYGEFFEFHPVAKFWLAFNHKPLVADDSHGFWRRIRLIPFLQEFCGKNNDKQLPDKLKEEAPGILNWIVEGCLKWQRDGLGVPTIVKEATGDYRDESDPIGEFVSDCCIVHTDASVSAANLWEEYQHYVRENGLSYPLDRKMFTQRLETRGFKRGRAGHARTRMWVGVCRKVDAEAQHLPTEVTKA
jgi:putative DNA primase/helicase